MEFSVIINTKETILIQRKGIPLSTIPLILFFVTKPHITKLLPRFART